MNSSNSATRSISIAAAMLLCLAALTPSLVAQVSRYGEKETGPSNDKPPAILNGVGVAQRLNEQLPLDLTFTDDTGKPVQLASYFGKKARHPRARLLSVPDALL